MSVTNNKPTGREAAMQRRNAQKLGRSARAGSQPTAQRAAVPAAVAANPASSGRAAAMQRRLRQVEGRRAGPEPVVRQAPVRPQPEKQEATPPAPERVAGTTSARSSRAAKSRRPAANNAPVVAPKGRLQSRAYRNAQVRGKSTVDALRSQSGSPASLARVANPKATGREIARQVRAERCTRGKVCSTGGSRRGNGRGAPPRSSDPETVPAKVNRFHTERGQSVTGPKIGPGEAMTGGEAGTCKSVTGTQYLGPDLFSSLCGTTPEPGPAKVSVSTSQKGLSVSGTLVGRSRRVTGDEVGTCRSVTGTDYLPADQSELFCGTQAPARERREPIRNTVMSRREESAKAEPAASGSSRVTGKNLEAPAKVVVSSTPHGSRISGSSVDRPLPVTGGEHGRCKGVTGTPYLSVETVQQTCGTNPEPGAVKVREASTFAGQRVTGARVGNGERLTGAEAGHCEPVSGTSYLGPDQIESCSTEARQAIVERSTPRRRGGVSVMPVSGRQPGLDQLTGAERGACEPVSGTPYLGQDQVQGYCGGHFEAEPGDPDYPTPIMAQAPEPVAMTAEPVAPAMPAARSRMTGDFARGAGKVTGESESWGGRQGASAQPAAAVAPAASGRLTGEAARNGTSITGDAWDRGNRVTGTEGPWATQRNVTYRGNAPGGFAGAAMTRDQLERELPEARISGSAGNTRAGALVTVSGGARG